MKKVAKVFSLILAIVMVLEIPMVGLASTSTYSKYTDKTYTNNSIFDSAKKLNGVDVSEWQGNGINWKSVKADGIDYAVIRSGYGRYASQVDDSFETNYKNASAVDMPLGTYWYSYADSIEAVKLEANACLSVIKGKSFDLPVFFDLEEQFQLNKGSKWCTQAVETFCDIIAKAGYTPGLYMSRSPLTDYISASVRDKYELWVAEYDSKTCKYSGGDYMMWQYADNGKVNGISGNVDMNFWYVKSNIQAANIKVYNQRYAGSAITPNPTVTLNGSTLKNGTDYTVSYSNNDKAGTATIKITGIGEYKGTKSKTFVIYPQIVSSISASTVTSDSASFKWSSSKGATGYQIYLINTTTNKSVYKYTTSTSATVSGLDGGSKYTAKVRPYVTSGGSNYYGYYKGYAESTTNPGNVAGIKDASRGYTAIKLTWDKQPYVTGYKVYKYISSTGKYYLLGETTSTSYTASNLSSGYGYRLCVRAYRTDGNNTSYSPIINYIDTCTRTQTPAVTSVKSNSSKRITVKWKTVPVGSGYQIQYSKSSNFSSGVKSVYVNGKNYSQKTFATPSKGTYYVRIKSYRTINSTKFYGYNGKTYKVTVK